MAKINSSNFFCFHTITIQGEKKICVNDYDDFVIHYNIILILYQMGKRNYFGHHMLKPLFILRIPVITYHENVHVYIRIAFSKHWFIHIKKKKSIKLFSKNSHRISTKELL